MAGEQASSERYLKMSDLRKQAEKRYPLWEFFAEEHDLILTEGQLDDIIHAVKEHLANGRNEDTREACPS